MEILILVLLYYFSQNPNFAESVKPLMSKLKDSEQMLGFLNDLSKFSQAFGVEKTPLQKEKDAPKKEPDKKTPTSPTAGIAVEFIENILENYLKNH